MSTRVLFNNPLKLSPNVALRFAKLLPINNQIRFRSHLPYNTIIEFVPQQEAWVIERMGRFHKILNPGLNFLIPVIDSVKYVQSLKEIAIEVPQQSAITKDNVTLHLDGVLYLRVVDPYKASYGVEDPEFAVTQLAQTTMRSEIGKISLDNVFRERDSLNIAIVEAINKASNAWGISCMRYEIRDIKLPQRVHEAMIMQVEAERKKRAAILESEGVRESAINTAEGNKMATILNSEAIKMDQINKASGEAQAIIAKAQATAEALHRVSKSLAEQNGKGAAALSVAEQYVRAFGQLAKNSNTLLLPTDTGNVSNMVAQAFAIYRSIDRSTDTQLTADGLIDQGSTPTNTSEINECSEQSKTNENKPSSSNTAKTTFTSNTDATSTFNK